MIKNERQYLITKAQIARFVRTLESLSGDQGVHEVIHKAQRDAVRSQISDMKAEIQEYESLKAGDFKPDQLKTVNELPVLLIKARIAQGLSQKDLADRLGLKEQQIQRYEATDYASARLSRLREVVGALEIDDEQRTGV
jgi:ribosome-binding protein aMBF1 (putative translation factor)